MKLNMTIDWDVEDENPGVKEILEEVVREETKGFVASIHRRLREAGVTDLELKLKETD